MSEEQFNGGVECVVDTHVHVHACFEASAALDAAVAAFDRVASRPAAERLDVLCLTDVAGVCTDARLCAAPPGDGAWRYSRPASGAGALAERTDGRRLHLLPGRQMVSAEHLELLALDCLLALEDRRYPLNELVERTLEAGGVPVLPWGFGKWLGARGRVVRALIESRSDFLLADNGNRLRGTRWPALLEAGRRKGVAILAGSDPLPLASQAAQTGSHGIRGCVAAADATSPSCAFRALARSGTWSAFGPLTPPAVFLLNQVRMQIHKRIGGRS